MLGEMQNRFSFTRATLKYRRAYTSNFLSILPVIYFVFLGQEGGLSCRGESPEELTKGLNDGIYLIERVNFTPPLRFKTRQEARAWLEKARRSPGMVKPADEVYNLYLHGNDFIVRQLQTSNGLDYSPKGNFFVSVSTNGSWAYEEFANRVTVLQNSTRRSTDGGPVRGLLTTGESFASELRNLGLARIDWASIRVGQSRKSNAGEPTNKARFDPSGEITNIFCGAEEHGTPYDKNFDIVYDQKMQVSSVLISNRRKGDETWAKAVEYRVIHASPLETAFDMSTFWKRYANSNTLVVFYDVPERTLRIRLTNGVIQPIGNLVAGKGQIAGGLARAFSRAVFALSTLVAVVLVVKAVTAPKWVKK